MKKVKIQDAIISAFHSHSKKKFLLVCLALFIFIAAINIFNAAKIQGSNAMDVLFFSFCGTSIVNTNLALNLQWLLIQLILIAMIGDFTFNQIFYKGTFILIRFKSKYMLWISQIIYISIVVFIFLILGFSVVYLLSLIVFSNVSNEWFHSAAQIYNIPTNVSALHIIAQMFILLYLSSLCSVIMQSLISVITKNILFPLVFIIILHAFTLNSGKIDINSVKWIIGNQSMLVRHTIIDHSIKNFSITWSLIYTTLVIVIIVLIGFYVIHKTDLFIEQKN